MRGSFEKTALFLIYYLLLLLYLLFSAAPITICSGHIISLKLRYDKRHMIPLANFQFSDHVGHVSFLISSVSTVTASQPSRIGFILQPREVRNKTRFKLEENNTICALDFKLNSVLFTLQNLSHNNNNNNSLINKKSSFPVTYSGMKSLLFVNCNNESLVTMEGRAELYNMNDITTKNYLSAGGLSELPFLSFILSFLYLCFLGFWILVCFSNRQAFSRTHLLMGGLLLINSVYFICVATDLLYVKATGTAHGLDILFSVLQLIRALFFFTMVVLISVGWFLWKPFGDHEIASLTLVVILLQLCANVINPILPWEFSVDLQLSDSSIDASMLDFLCCLYIIFGPITWEVFSLQTVCETDLNANRNLEKLSVFRMLLVVYMFITRVIVLLISTDHYWVIYAVKETSTFVFHMAMFYIFRPVDKMKKINKPRWNHESWLSTN